MCSALSKKLTCMANHAMNHNFDQGNTKIRL
ncbi:hypothetical protein EYZ11_011214 [Aspergillus tanneri]|uniref:Uncharacterized protein n=1 Tax=Aspergillus tanneri TaxID=1220188 RepID=A0A4S3J5K0_9EURO|nr:hypothetical protein EYZ11_011214 [Aspergillus tanneri]